MTMRSPFSGDVTQSILPWTFFSRFLGQIGFININNAKTPDPGLENAIVDEVGSYGRQIGRIADALDVLVGTIDRSKLSEKQLLAIMAFREQLGEVRAVKSAGRPVADGDLSKPAAKLIRAAIPE
jgi:hypothetical protein